MPSLGKNGFLGEEVEATVNKLTRPESNMRYVSARCMRGRRLVHLLMTVLNCVTDMPQLYFRFFQRFCNLQRIFSILTVFLSSTVLFFISWLPYLFDVNRYVNP